jgi:predicted CXXCH cytochrome family protein
MRRDRSAVTLAVLLALGALAPGAAAPVFAESIVNSRHNLSVSGPGAVKAASESQVCIFCHTPHDASGEAPLWNRSASASTYLTYASSTALAAPGQPSGASKLCLSCHDGTIALGMVRSPATAIPMAGSATLPAGASRLGTDLSDDHPVSFAFDQALSSRKGDLVNPSLLTGAVRLDQAGNLQCTSCHDAHDDRYGKFLVVQNGSSALCLTCHVPSGWTGSIHATSTAAWNGVAPNPWPHTKETTVAANGCESCHKPHGAGSPVRLLNAAPSEANCLPCHNGHVAARNVPGEFSKTSVHPIAASDVHDPTEDTVNPPRHVECVDCHNPHEATAAASLLGARGVSSAGSPLARISFEYELCFRCHADSLGRGAATVNRQFPQTNTRLEFSPASSSYHPLLAAGKNPDVPSLVSPYTTSSIMSCTDCHNSNSSPAAGGIGPNGPHGSLYRPILERQLVIAEGSTESLANYALCYKCHSRTSIRGDVSFKEHTKHLDLRVSCMTCHDPHGVESAAHLVNFNRQYVTPSSSGRLEFVDSGRFRGSCYLTCHGENHNPYSY